MNVFVPASKLSFLQVSAGYDGLETVSALSGDG